MAQLRIGLAQTDFTVGALDANFALILARTREAHEQGARLIAFGRMALTGFPVKDLAKRSSFTAAAGTAVETLTTQLADEGLGDMVVIVGGLGVDDSGAPAEHTFALHRGEVVAVIDAAPKSPVQIELDGFHVALTTAGDASEPALPTEADLWLIIDGAPYIEGGPDSRHDQLRRLAGEAATPLAYVNLAGAQDALVFTGGSCLIGAEGQTLAQAPLFDEHLLVLDVPGPGASGTHGHRLSPTLEPDAQTYQAIVTGLRSYVLKNGFRSVVLGMSGGIDSALVAVIAADAIGGKNVVGVSMPSSFSSEHSRTDAADLAERIGAFLVTHPIETMVDVFTDALDLQGVAQENLQARVRGLILMGLSNSHGHLVLAPGNKSELAVGYSTIYGDAVGGFGPLKDLLKSRVWDLARWRNNHALDTGQIPPIPESSITKPPSAELRPGQVDQDSLPPYDILDPLLTGYIEENLGRPELLERGFTADVIDHVITLVDRAEWKRQQYPIGPKVSQVALGEDRHMPITNAWHEPAPILSGSDRNQGAQRDAP